MKRILFSIALFPVALCAQPQCSIDTSDSERLIGLVSGSATGFAPGRVYVTVTNGARKYTTLCDQEGRWALTYADIENSSEILCWQDGDGQRASAAISR